MNTYALAVFLCIFPFGIDDQPDHCRTCNTYEQVCRVEAWGDILNSLGKSAAQVQELAGKVNSGGKPHRLGCLIEQPYKEQIGEVQDQQLFNIYLFHSSIPLSFCLLRFSTLSFFCTSSFMLDMSLRIDGFFAWESCFAENSLNAAVITSASLPLKNTR